MTNIFRHFTSTELDTDSRGRIYYFDNLKFWLIMLVVIAHFTYPADHINWFYEGLAKFVITVPMPVFIFITGYFAKSIIDKKTGRFKFERILQFLILYLFLTLVIFCINYYLLQNTSTYKFFQPLNPGWYLFTCIFWYALIPLIHHIKPKYVMIGSVVLALIVGMDPMVGDFLALSRIICFFPFFIAGYYVTQDKVEKLLRFGGGYIRIIAAVFLIAFLIFCLWDPVGYGDFRQIISPHYPYKEISKLGDFYNLTGPLVRLMWYVGSTVTTIAFMYIVPRCKTFYTKLGTRTLQVFIWHSIAIRLLRYAGMYTFIEASGTWYSLTLPIVVAVALTFLFSWKPLGAPFNWVLANKFEFLYKKLYKNKNGESKVAKK